MKKAISLIISSMMMLSMVGCGNGNECIKLQDEVDMFESINTYEVEKCCVEHYYESFEESFEYYNALTTEEDENMLSISYSEGSDNVGFDVIMFDEEIYNNFKEDVEEIGLEDTREKYGIDELIETMIDASDEQRNTISEIQDDEHVSEYDKAEDIYIRLVTYIDGKLESVIVIHNNEVETDLFN